MRVVDTVVLWVAGLSLLGFGIAFCVAPLATFAAAGLVLEGPLAATELRAFYGGLELALGALMLGCAIRPARRRDGLVLVFAVFAGIGVTRLFAMLASGADTGFLRAALATELALALLAGFSLLRRD